jgi:hypothetical protein
MGTDQGLAGILFMLSSTTAKLSMRCGLNVISPQTPVVDYVARHLLRGVACKGSSGPIPASDLIPKSFVVFPKLSGLPKYCLAEPEGYMPPRYSKPPES